MCFDGYLCMNGELTSFRFNVTDNCFVMRDKKLHEAYCQSHAVNKPTYAFFALGSSTYSKTRYGRDIINHRKEFIPLVGEELTFRAKPEPRIVNAGIIVGLAIFFLRRRHGFSFLHPSKIFLVAYPSNFEGILMQNLGLKKNIVQGFLSSQQDGSSKCVDIRYKHTHGDVESQTTYCAISRRGIRRNCRANQNESSSICKAHSITIIHLHSAISDT